MRRYLLSAVLAVAAAACGGDDGTGPTGSLNVEGTWSASVSNLSGGGASCHTSTPVQVTTCLTPTESFSSALGSGNVTNGQLAGTTVTFDLGSPDFHHSGTVNGTSMSGTAAWNYDFGPPLDDVMLAGSWSATRQ
jgi:hypothetical protein